MPIAIHEDRLSGSSSLLEKFQRARDLGADGIELWGADLTEKIPEIAAAMEQTGVKVAAINHGNQGNLVSPEPDERERALKQLRQSIKNAVDLGASGVVVVPLFGDHVLPDLSPWMSAPQLEVEMFYMHLRTLSDFSEALGTNLYILPMSASETQLLNRLEQAARITRRLNHPRVRVAADLYCMALEESDIPAAIREHGGDIAYVHVAESSDLTSASEALRSVGYQGWITYNGDDLESVRKAGMR